MEVYHGGNGVKNILAYGNSTGSFNWRLQDPLRVLAKRGKFKVHCEQGEMITEEAIKWADIIILSSVVDKEGIALCHYYQKEHGKKIVVDSDDGLQLNDDSPFKVEHAIAQASDVIKITMGIADLVTTTTSYLAKQLKQLNENTIVLPNYMDMERWDLPKYKNDSEYFRIGWAGSITHLDDLKMIIDPLKQIMDEFPQVQLIFCGETRIADEFKGYPVECVLGVPFDAWPSRLQGLRLDLGLAPLRDTPFNKCKSNIKFLEYSIAKVPAIFSPTVYADDHRGLHQIFDGQFGHIAYTQDQWYRCIKNMILSKELREDMSTKAYAHVKRKYDLAKNIHMWEEAYMNLLDTKSNPS